MYAPSLDQDGPPRKSGLLTKSVHLSVLKSKSRSFLESADIATRCWPSGDQRGPNKFSDPGTVATFFVARSKVLMRIVSVVPGKKGTRPKTNRLPSGDQPASV